MGLYPRAEVFFLSGTGNSYRVACWVAQALREQGAAVLLAPLKRPLPAWPEDSPAAAIAPAQNPLVLTFPTHGFTAPWHVIKFACALPRGNGRPAVVLASRAGTEVGGVVLPGFEGTAVHLIALILLLKGYRIRALRGVDMPSNWLAVHPGFKPENAAIIIAKGQQQVSRLLERFLQGRRSQPWGVVLLLGLLVAPISLGYLLIGRFLLAKAFFASSHCNSCGLCAKFCPIVAVELPNPDAAPALRGKPHWATSCESCMRCMAFCPQKSIEASHLFWLLFLVLVIWLNPLLGMTAEHLLSLLPFLPAQIRASPFWHGPLSLGLHLLELLGLAWLFELTLRAPLARRLARYFTFTPLFRRYREPQAHLAQMMQVQVLRPESAASPQPASASGALGR